MNSSMFILKVDNSKTVKELREIAKNMKLSKYSTLNKVELINLINKNLNKPSS
jgi:transcription termination factor Rho